MVTMSAAPLAHTSTRGTGGQRGSFVSARPHILPNSDLRVCLEPLPSTNGGGYVGCKVITTLGPACQSVDTLTQMLRQGMAVARVDLTWGDLNYHMRSLNNLNEAMKRCHKLCAIMVDTLGREVMVRRPFVEDASGWPVHAELFSVAKGETVVLTTAASTTTAAAAAAVHAQDTQPPSNVPIGSTEGNGGSSSHTSDADSAYGNNGSSSVNGFQSDLSAAGSLESVSAFATPPPPPHHPDAKVVSLTYAGMPQLVEQGDTVYLGRYLACGAPEQGSLYMEVTEVHEEYLVCVAQNDAELGGLLTLFHPERSEHGLDNKQIDLPVLSQYDKDCLSMLASEFEIDFIGLSYTRSAADVFEAREFLDEVGLKETQVVAKMESRMALFNAKGIIDAASGVVISRGLLGLDVAPEKMALVQKALVTAANLAGKPAIITRVLDSMSESPRPTRAEATDVANIVLDGADGVLLGAETLRGRYPVDAVRMAVGICRQAEAVFDFRHHYDFLMDAAMSGASGLSGMMLFGGGDNSSNSNNFGTAGLLAPSHAAMAAMMMAGGLRSSHPSSTQLALMEEQTPSTPAHQRKLFQKVVHHGHTPSLKDHPAHSLTPTQTPSVVTQSHTPSSILPTPPANVVNARLSRFAATGNGSLPNVATPPSVSQTWQTASSTAGSSPSLVDLAPGITVDGPRRRAVAAGLASAIAAEIVEGRLAPATVVPGGSSAGDVAGAASAAQQAAIAAGSNGAAPPGMVSLADVEKVVEAMLVARGLMPAPPPAGPPTDDDQGGYSSGGGYGSYANLGSSRLAAAGVLPANMLTMTGDGGGSGGSGHAAGQMGQLGAVGMGGSGLGGSGMGGSGMSGRGVQYGADTDFPYMSKLESIASSAVRAAEKVKAGLILVLTHTSNAPQLIAKYRPPMPILTLVVPQLVSDGLKWKLEGRAHARQCLLTRGLLPMLSAPGPSGDEVLEEAVAAAARWGLVSPHQYVVVVERIHEHFAVKIVTVDDLGLGIKRPGEGGGRVPTPGGAAAAAMRRHTTTSMYGGGGGGGGAGLGAMTMHGSPLPTIRTMVPATPTMVGRTLSMMGDSVFGYPPGGSGGYNSGAYSNGGYSSPGGQHYSASGQHMPWYSQQPGQQQQQQQGSPHAGYAAALGSPTAVGGPMFGGVGSASAFQRHGQQQQAGGVGGGAGGGGGPFAAYTRQHSLTGGGGAFSSGSTLAGGAGAGGYTGPLIPTMSDAYTITQFGRQGYDAWPAASAGGPTGWFDMEGGPGAAAGGAVGGGLSVATGMRSGSMRHSGEEVRSYGSGHSSSNMAAATIPEGVPVTNGTGSGFWYTLSYNHPPGQQPPPAHRSTDGGYGAAQARGTTATAAGGAGGGLLVRNSISGSGGSSITTGRPANGDVAQLPSPGAVGRCSVSPAGGSSGNNAMFVPAGIPAAAAGPPTHTDEGAAAAAVAAAAFGSIADFQAVNNGSNLHNNANGISSRSANRGMAAGAAGGVQQRMHSAFAAQQGAPAGMMAVAEETAQPPTRLLVDSAPGCVLAPEEALAGAGGDYQAPQKQHSLHSHPSLNNLLLSSSDAAAAHGAQANQAGSATSSNAAAGGGGGGGGASAVPDPRLAADSSRGSQAGFSSLAGSSGQQSDAGQVHMNAAFYPFASNLAFDAAGGPSMTGLVGTHAVGANAGASAASAAGRGSARGSPGFDTGFDIVGSSPVVGYSAMAPVHVDSDGEDAAGAGGGGLHMMMPPGYYPQNMMVLGPDSGLAMEDEQAMYMEQDSEQQQLQQQLQQQQLGDGEWEMEAAARQEEGEGDEALSRGDLRGVDAPAAEAEKDDAGKEGFDSGASNAVATVEQQAMGLAEEGSSLAPGFQNRDRFSTAGGGIDLAPPPADVEPHGGADTGGAWDETDEGVQDLDDVPEVDPRAGPPGYGSPGRGHRSSMSGW